MQLEVDIHKDLGKFRLDCAFTATGGQVVGLLGASGCGKSLTLRCIAGIDRPDRGRIVLDGRVLFDSEKRIDLPPQKRRVGLLFQHYALFPNMTVAQNIAVGIRDRATQRERTQRLIDAFYLTGQEHKYPRQLSGGQQQRVALARILASEPALLLLDEPFSALDSYLKWQVELELSDILTAFPGPMLLVTHDRDEVQRLCQQVCVLDRGRSQPVMPVRALFEAPRTLSACLLSGCKNVSRARPTADGRVEALDWGVVLDPGRPVPPDLSHIGVRAHYLRPADGPGADRICCRVERVVENVFSTVVILSTPGGRTGFSRLRIELDKADWAAWADRDPLWLALRPDDVLLLTR
ncbi:MAG: ATP-binding cassette domain-containing protein [Eubacteriales bacterium]|nr:ATP-binding cassette domain-containing protein [Eubacteriales bacterium]